VFRDRPERFGLCRGNDHGWRSSRPPRVPRRFAHRVFWTISLAKVLTKALGTGLLLNHFDLLLRGGVSREEAVIVFAPLSITQARQA